MGPMDVYLGSSPTPHARREKRFVGSDQMSIATPTAVRPIAPHMDEAGFGSSPPRFEKAHVEAVQQAESNDLISNTQLPQPEDVLMSLQEDPVEENDTQDPEPAPNSDSEEFSDIALADVLSSSLDLQLTAQLDAEIEAHMGVAPDQDPASLSQHPHLPVEQVEAHASANPRDRSSPASSTVLNTEAALAAESNDASHLASPLSRNLRRSSRRTTSSPLHVSSPRRSKRALSDNGSIADARDTPIALAKTRSTLQAEVTVSEPVDEPEMFDNIVVESPAKSRTRTKKRKSTSALPSSQDSVISVVHQERKRGPIRRSQSLLGLVENSQEDVFEEHRAPKRARQKEEQDVSEVRIVPSTVLESQSTRQFNHVQVTPRRSSSIASQDTPAVTNGEGRASTILATPSRSFAERVILTPRSIIDRLKSLKDYLLGAPQLVLGREEEREIAETIMHIQWQVHAAGVRGEDQQKVTK